MEVDSSPPKINNPTMGPLSHLRDRLMRGRLPIRLKITLPYFFLSVLIAFGAAILVTRVVFDSIEERFNNQLIDAGKMSSEWMVRKEDQLLESIRLLTNADGVANAITANDAEQIRHLVFGIVVNNQVEAVEFLAPDGRPILSMRHIAGGKV